MELITLPIASMFWRILGVIPITLIAAFLGLWFLFSFIPGSIQYIRMKLTGCVKLQSWDGWWFRRNVKDPAWQMYDRNWWWYINHWFGWLDP